MNFEHLLCFYEVFYGDAHSIWLNKHFGNAADSLNQPT